MAKKIQWNKSLTVGNDFIDEQHKILFDLANDLNNAVTLGANKRVIDTLFAVIMDYSFKHFAVEEEDIKEDPDYKNHCYKHYQLLKQLHEYSVDYRNGRKVSEPPALFLENWLVTHIKKNDIPLLSGKAGASSLVKVTESVDSFTDDQHNKRKHKRVRYDKILDEKIVGRCYNTTTLQSGNVTVVDLSSGGLKIFAEQKIYVGDLLVISCRVGSNFKMKEKVRVKNSYDKYYGVEFVSPEKETVQFLTQLCGAVHMYGAR
jgi:hemerythrin